MQLIEIINVIEQFAPPVYQESYDNAGLITGSAEMEINGALICLDSTEAVLDEAIKKKCNLVIAHHPIVFSGIKKLNGKNYVERTIIKAIKNDIAIYAAHTNLDNVFNGVNHKIAEKLGLINLKILTPMNGKLRKLVTFVPITNVDAVRNALFDAGAGRIGNYDECSFNTEGVGTYRGNEVSNPTIGEKGKRQMEPEIRIEVIYETVHENSILSALRQSHIYEEAAYDIYPLENSYQHIGSGMVGEFEQARNAKDFLTHVKSVMKTNCVRHTALLPENIKKVAICGGSGSFLLSQAIMAGAQAFITADFKYHQFFDADNRILIADIGHYESEQFTGEIFENLIRQKFNTFAVHLSETNTNPVNYWI